MRLGGFHLHNVGPFEDLEVDLTALGPEKRLVAFTGPNGCGKSSALEAGFAGAIFRACPTRGPLLELATARDAFVESRVVNGKALKLRHLLDPVSKKSEAVVMLDDGSDHPLTASAKVRDFDRWAAKHLPTPEVFYASIFASQGSGGLLAATAGAQKATILRLLGVEQLEGLAARARDNGRDMKARLDIRLARIDEQRAQGGDVAAITREIAALEEAAAGADQALETARRELQEARDLKPKIEADRALAKATRERRSELETRLVAKRAEIEQLKARISNNRLVLADAASIRAAHETSLELDREIAQLDADRKLLEDRKGANAAQIDTNRERSDAAAGRAQSSSERHLRAGERLEQRPRIEAAVEAIPGLERGLRDAETEQVEIAAELQRLLGQHIAGADERILGLRFALADIRHGADVSDGPDEWHARLESVERRAGDAIEIDDAAQKDAAETPALINGAEQLLSAKRDRIAVLSRRLSDLRVAAAEAHHLENWERECAESAEENRQACAEQRAVSILQSECIELVKKYEREERAILERRGAAERERSKLSALASKHPHLANAEGRLAEIEPQLVTAGEEITRLETTLAETPEPPEPAKLPELGALEGRVGHAEKAVHGAREAVSLAKARLERATEAATKIAELDQERRRLEDELSDWTRLGSDLGRDGLQAMLVDAAGPEISAIANDLLWNCFGPRWTISIETTRVSSDGKRVLEGCEVRVLDTQNGRDAEASTFSGGERVILSEALSLSLSMLACRRNGVRGCTLVRDESGAALDAGNARAYVAMLRRAAELVDADKVLLVSHSSEVVDLCDHVIDLGKR